MGKKKKDRRSIPDGTITERELRKVLDEAMRRDGSATAWAKRMKITPQQVNAFLIKTQGAGLKIPELLGYRPQTVYIPIDAELITTPVPSRRLKRVVEPPKKNKKHKKGGR